MSLLTGTFPSCQFVATTHSPQIIGETQPEHIILLLSEAGRILPRRCGQAYGLDTNAILEQIMGTPSRAEPARSAIRAVEAALDDGDLVIARAEVAALRAITDLTKWMDANGSLATLRHGFKCYGKTLRVAYFKAAHALNPELEARYAANRVGITRQLRFSKSSEKSLDVALSINGVPVASVELKNPMTGQTVDHALRQYRADRDPREPIFEFKRRMLVHFAADTEAVFMTTRLAGSATHFLPFNRGCDGGAGNPPDPTPNGD